MYIISGCPRSGTSLMMDIMRVAFGEDRINGKKFPQERFNLNEKQDEETHQHYDMRLYNKQILKKKYKRDDDDYKDLNPNGFFEMKYSVRGIFYTFQDREILNDILNEERKTICKIVSQGLINSEPKYIDRIIYMLRHPRNVAKSQERLKRNEPVFGDMSKLEANGQQVVIHTPEMFINVTYQACKWLLAYPEVPITIINYDDLTSKPSETIDKINQFIGEEDANFEEAKKCVDLTLKRSEPQDRQHPMWEDAEIIYELMSQYKFKDVVDYFENPKINFHEYSKRFYCPRRDMQTSKNECLLCRTSPSTMNNYKKTSITRQIDWQKEPCAYECGFDLLDETPKTIEESIKNNTWIYGVQ